MATPGEDDKKPVDLSEEEVFDNDKDPLEAIREIRRKEGVPEDELPESRMEDVMPQEETTEVEGDDELDNLEPEKADDSKPAPDENDTGVEEDEQTPDESTGEEEESDDKAPDTDEEPKPAEVEKKRKFSANGKEFEFTEAEILEQFETVFGKAMDYTNKTKTLAPYRKMISALEEENISAEQLNLAIDAIKGNKDAIKQLISSNDIDAYDLTGGDDDEKTSYIPPQYGKNDHELAIKEIADSISGDEEYKITVDVIDKQWDDKSRQELSNNPQLIKGLHNDIKSGVYDKVAPAAMKMKVLDGNTKSDIEYYMLAGQQVLGEQESVKTEQPSSDKTEAAQGAEEDFDQASSEAQRKRSASATRTRSDRKGVIDYLDDDDEKYEEWYERTMNQ